MIITILGCGPSQGVPSINGGWGNCDPLNPKNYRRRSSLLIEIKEKNFLIDTSPDIRDQLIHSKTTHLDALFYTHAHADHLHGIDEIRAINQLMQAPIPTYADIETLNIIKERFGYVLEHPKDGVFYRPCLTPHEIKDSFNIHDVKIKTFEQDHGHGMRSIGYRINDLGYSTDVVALDQKAFDILKGVKVWIVDCLREKQHKTHSHLKQTLEWINVVKPELAILTHMGPDLDYDTLFNNLPDGVLPAYDGMVMQISD